MGPKRKDSQLLQQAVGSTGPRCQNLVALNVTQEAGEMALTSRAPALVAEDLSLVLGTHIRHLTST